MPQEINYKVKFAEKYFDPKLCAYDINYVDLVLSDARKNPLLYIESKDVITNEQLHRQALAQAILTNKKQKEVLSRVALIFRDAENNDVLELLDCSENDVMYNNDINWKAEKPSNPTKDAVDRINDRLTNRGTQYKNDEIREFYKNLKSGTDTAINITLQNFNVVYSGWKNNVLFREEILDEQDFINLFLVDILNGTKYKQTFETEMGADAEIDLVREGTNLSCYRIMYADGKIDGIRYAGQKVSSYYTIADAGSYEFFWKKYKRPPEKTEFLAILERSATLYSDKYRRDTGGEYTPACFVQKQNEILTKHYNLNDFIVVDPCAGVGNLENQFGKDFKSQCYLSTLEKMDVDICHIKGFENAVQFDFLAGGGTSYEVLGTRNSTATPSTHNLEPSTYPKWKYKGREMDITEIAEREGKKLLVIMNPPYQNKKGFANNLAIEFFNKVLAWQPDVIVFYYMTESFLRSEIEHYIKSGYKIRSHIFSNAKTTFQLSEWPISQIVFEKPSGDVSATPQHDTPCHSERSEESTLQDITRECIKADRYEINKKTGTFDFVKTYVYNNSRPNLIDEIDKKIKENESGLVLGNYSYMTSGYSINLTNKISKHSKEITDRNIAYCLLCKGLIFNTHNKYFERNQYVYKGKVEEIPIEIFNDAIMFSLFYKNCAFTNKGQKNYIMPFTAAELGCGTNDLNTLFASDAQEPSLFDEEKEQTDLLKANAFRSKDVSNVSCEQIRVSNKNSSTHNPVPTTCAKGAKDFDFRKWLSQFTFSDEAKALHNAALQIFRYYHASPQYAGKDWNDSFYDITNAIMGKDANSFRDFESATGKEDTRITKTKTTKGTKGFGRNTIKYAVSSEQLPIFTAFFDARDVLARKVNRQLVESGLLLWERENIY